MDEVVAYHLVVLRRAHLVDPAEQPSAAIVVALKNFVPRNYSPAFPEEQRGNLYVGPLGEEPGELLVHCQHGFDHSGVRAASWCTWQAFLDNRDAAAGEFHEKFVMWNRQPRRLRSG
jgi:hypothetical protein